MAKVYAQNKQFSGLRCTVNFINGEGETDNEYLLNWFKDNGYTVEDELNKNIEITEPELIIPVDSDVMVEYDLEELEQKSNKELMTMLDARGIEYRAKATKAELIELLA